MPFAFKLWFWSSSSALFFVLFLRSLGRQFKLISKLETARRKRKLSPTQLLAAFEKDDKSVGIEQINQNEKAIKRAFVLGKAVKFENQRHVDYIYHVKEKIHEFTNNRNKVKERTVSSFPFKMVDLESSDPNKTAFVSVHQNNKVNCLLTPERILNVRTPIKLTFTEKIGLICSSSISILASVLDLPQPLKNIFVGITDSELVIKFNQKMLVYGDIVYNFTDKTMRIDRPLKLIPSPADRLFANYKGKINRNAVFMGLFLGAAAISFYYAWQIIRVPRRKPAFNHKIEIIQKEKLITTQGKDFRCMVCRNKPKNMILHPCAHLVMCKDCVGRNRDGPNTCPLCHKAFTETIEILIP